MRRWARRVTHGGCLLSCREESRNADGPEEGYSRWGQSSVDRLVLGVDRNRLFFLRASYSSAEFVPCANGWSRVLPSRQKSWQRIEDRQVVGLCVSLHCPALVTHCVTRSRTFVARWLRVFGLRAPFVGSISSVRGERGFVRHFGAVSTPSAQLAAAAVFGHEASLLSTRARFPPLGACVA